MQPRSLTSGDLALALLVPLLWGFNFVVMKYAVTEASPMYLVGVRFLLAAIPLVFFVPKPDASWRALTAYAVMFAIVKFGLLFTAFRWGAPAGLASVVLQMQAIITVILALLVFGERPGRPEVVGLALAAAGLAAIFYGVSGGAAFAALGLVFAACSAWSVANLVNKSVTSADPLGFVVWTSAIAAAIVWPVLLVIEGPAQLWATTRGFSPLGWGAVLYLIYPVSLVSGIIWSRLITRYPAALVTPFALLTPAVGLASSAVVYGERLSLPTIVGAAAICAGLAIITLAPRAAAITQEKTA